VDLELLPNNPLEHVKLRRPIIAQAVDRRVVVNPAQAKALLTAVRATYPALEAYFACLFTTPPSVPPRRGILHQGLSTP
jgi:hypothetical protein